MISAFVLLLIYFKLNNKKSGKSKYGFINAIIVWNIYSFIAVELLSALSFLTWQGVTLIWGIPDIIMLFRVISIWGHNLESRLNLRKEILSTGRFIWRHKLIVFAGAAVLLLAAVTIPYTPDSLSYHLPRIAQWAQNQSVAHFATNDVRQLSSPMLAEFINVQVYILSGKRDNFLNLLQAFSYLVNAWLVYKIAVKIGCKEKFASLAVFLFMTMPIAFGEALTTQVDLFATIWLLIFVYYYIDVYEVKQLTAERDVLTACINMGFCIAFGYLAKPSVNIGMAVLLLLLLAKCIQRKDRFIELGKILLCVLPAVFLPILPELLRNFQTFAAFSDPSTGKRQLVGTLQPNYLFINFLKNFAQNWPNLYLYDSEEWIAKIVMIAAGILKVNINDASIAEDGISYILPQAPVYGHDTALNPVVIILAALSFIFALVRIRRYRNTGNKYSLWAMVLFMVFCCVVRWEPFVTRYMLSYLAVLCPMIGWQVQVFTESFRKEELRKAVLPVIYFVCAAELFSLCRYHQEVWHEDASVRPEHFFLRNKDSRAEYIETLEWIKENGYRKIGIKSTSSGFEYVIWYILREPGLQIEHIQVENVSAVYEDFSYIPECIVGNGCLGEDESVMMIHDSLYEKAEEFSDNRYIGVYLLSK